MNRPSAEIKRVSYYSLNYLKPLLDLLGALFVPASCYRWRTPFLLVPCYCGTQTFSTRAKEQYLLLGPHVWIHLLSVLLQL
jgi:hypothetical protein